MMTFHVMGRPAVDCRDLAQCPVLTNEAVWIDLFEPTEEEEKKVEAALGIDVPTREHMQEIESSSRLRRENGVLFMTSQVLSQSDTRASASTAITFILDTKQRLVTVRYAEPAPFRTVRIYRDTETEKLGSGQAVLKALIDAIVDRLADILETVGAKLDEISSELFVMMPPAADARPQVNGAAKASTRNASQRPNYRDILVRVGRCNDLISKARESGVGLGRVISFLQEDCKKVGVGGEKELGRHLKTVGIDLATLGEHTSYLSSKANFLSVRYHPRSDQHRTERDHQDFLCGCSRTSAADAGGQRLRDEFRGDARVEVVVRLPVRFGTHGRFSCCALFLVQEKGLVVGWSRAVIITSPGVPRNGVFPVTISQSVIPSEYRSERMSAPIPANCSGLANSPLEYRSKVLGAASERKPELVHIDRLLEKTNIDIGPKRRGDVI
jgi:magnesium transporter